MNIFAKRIIIVLFMSFVSACYCCASDITEDYMDIANNYYREGNKAKALEYAKQILKLEENNTDAKNMIIKLSPPTHSKNIPDDSNKFLIFDTPYVETGNATSDKMYKAGFECYKSADYTSAENYLKSAIQANPQNYRAYNTLGLVYCAENKLDLARSYFRKSNDLNNSYTIPLNNLAQVYKKCGDVQNSYLSLTKSLSINSKDYWVYLLLGDLFRENGEFTNALTSYREIIKLKPDYYPAYLKIAQTRENNLDYSGANETLNYYSKINPKDDYAFYLMAKNYIVLKQYDKAKESIFKAISMNNCYEYREILGKINFKNNEIQEALDALLGSINKNSPSDVYNYVGMCYYNLHDYNNAVSNITKALETDDKRVIYYYNLAQIYSILKDNVNYSKYMSLIQNFEPVTAQDYIDLSGVLLSIESKNSAIIALNKGIEKYPKNKLLYNEKLKIYNITNDIQGESQTKTEMETIFK